MIITIILWHGYLPDNDFIIKVVDGQVDAKVTHLGDVADPTLNM